jgi:hypothetical protein
VHDEWEIEARLANTDVVYALALHYSYSGDEAIESCICGKEIRVNLIDCRSCPRAAVGDRLVEVTRPLDRSIR